MRVRTGRSMSQEVLVASEQQLGKWREEQHYVASHVIIVNDEESVNIAGKDTAYELVPLENNSMHQQRRYYGGVDVSFPPDESQPAAAVYAILNEKFETVYLKHEFVTLCVAYISSFLAFREIEPLERLIKTQIKERPDLTPSSILVDGNGIMHTASAGIACFVGLRTGIPTIGVAKTLFHHDGLTTKIVAHGISDRIHRLLQLQEIKRSGKCKEMLLVDVDSICADDEATRGSGPATSKVIDSDTMSDLVSVCRAFAVRLKGQSGRIWGAALLGHGGRLNPNRRQSGTKKPIFISVGHGLSLKEAIAVCTKMSRTRIPEPIRVADLYGRELVRTSII